MALPQEFFVSCVHSGRTSRAAGTPVGSKASQPVLPRCPLGVAHDSATSRSADVSVLAGRPRLRPESHRTVVDSGSFELHPPESGSSRTVRASHRLEMVECPVSYVAGNATRPGPSPNDSVSAGPAGVIIGRKPCVDHVTFSRLPTPSGHCWTSQQWHPAI